MTTSIDTFARRRAIYISEIKRHIDYISEEMNDIAMCYAIGGKESDLYQLQQKGIQRENSARILDSLLRLEEARIERL